MKRREAKRKGEKERYGHLNAKFQRTARRDKKAFFSDQCREIEGRNSRKSRRFSPPGEMRPISAEASRG